MRSLETDRPAAIKKLKEDINNTGRHVLGFHNLCSTDFCKFNKQQCESVNKDDDNTNSIPVECNDDFIVDQCDYWQDAQDLTDTQESVLRIGGKT